jgi:hypothetical protein
VLQTSCTLALYNVTKENLILVAKINKESPDTHQKPPVDLLKREKVRADKILVLFELLQDPDKKGKVKVTLEQTMKAQTGSRCLALLFL